MMRRTGVLFAATLLALVVFSGVALAATISCVAGVDCFGTTQADTLNGTNSIDRLFGKGRGDTLNGFGSSDIMFGQGGADKLFGSSGIDRLTGGPGNDELSGGTEEHDFYHFGPAWGKDSITDSATSANMVVFQEPPEGTNLLVTDGLTIKLLSGDGPEVSNASATSTIDWDGNAIRSVISGAGDDQITGNAAANTINAATHGGADTISSGGGDDLITVNDGSPDDVVNCGSNLVFPGSGGTPDNDRVFFDPGDQIAENCEILN